MRETEEEERVGEREKESEREPVGGQKWKRGGQRERREKWK